MNYKPFFLFWLFLLSMNIAMFIIIGLQGNWFGSLWTGGMIVWSAAMVKFYWGKI